MAIYKDVEPLGVVSYKGESDDFDKGVLFILEKLDALPTADVIEVRSVEQLKWERDTAIEQLESYGVGFCETAELEKVKHGEWTCIHYDEEEARIVYECSACHGTIEKKPIDGKPEYCDHCGAKMDGRSDT